MLCGDSGARTHDLLHAMQALLPAELYPRIACKGNHIICNLQTFCGKSLAY